MPSREMLQAKTAFICADGTVVQRGDLVHAGHVIVASNRDKFGPPQVRFSLPEVEQATAAPGEKRDEQPQPQTARRGPGRPRKTDR